MSYTLQLFLQSSTRPGVAAHRVNWIFVLGLGLAILISASFWAGLALMVARVWK